MQGNSDTASSDAVTHDVILDVAVEAARAAAAVIRAGSVQLSSLHWELKGAADFVSEADRGAERAIAKIIAERLPDALILGEELSPEAGLSSAGLTFIADPLDGTTNFLHGYPQYAVSIGAVQGGVLVAGVVLNVTTSECFTAIVDRGAKLNAVPIRVSDVSEPSRALVGTGFPFKQHDLLERYARHFVAVSRATAGIRRAGSAALDLADVACGRFDGFWELDLAPWDIAAGILLVREAGGVVTGFSGEERDVAPGPVIAGNPDIHLWLLRTLLAADETVDSKQ